MTAENKIIVAFDMELRRPACVLIAAALGANRRAPHEFPTESWLLAPTPGIKLYETTPDELRAVAADVHKIYAKEKNNGRVI